MPQDHRESADASGHGKHDTRRIEYLPVFPLQRCIERHSLETLHLIFPGVAAAAIATMDKNTMPN